jgi:8-oxo-dGTP pyrophosphatase MutT (NUDIX family)
VAERVKAHTRLTLPADSLKLAAVLVPLLETEAGLSLVLTQRPANLGVHGGQPSFPGGHVEPTDADRWATALRETEEELGIAKESITRLGVLNDFRTVTRFHITPCVGILDRDVVFKPCEREVAEVFCVPLATFLNPTYCRTMRFSGRGPDRRVYFYLTAPHIVWGATAGMIRGLIELLQAERSPQSRAS